MREILFRGQRKNNGEWIEGGIHCDEEKVRIIIQTRYYPDTRDWDTVEYYENNPVYRPTFIEVIPETIGQWTGLVDMNGKKIFEGDIVNIQNHETMVNGYYQVIYSEENHCYALQRSTEYHYNYFSFSGLNGFNETSEVVGNIHDNPELLETKQ